VGHLVWTKDYHSSERFVRYAHEAAYLLAKGNPDPPRVVLRNVLDWRYTGDALHPTQKPVMALLPLIMAYSRFGDIVLDPFAGSGTTAVAAETLGRRYIGVDIILAGTSGKIRMPVGFIDIPYVSALLGQEGFFDAHRITFERYHSIFTISPIKHKRA
jgi:hypothetical protein